MTIEMLEKMKNKEIIMTIEEMLEKLKNDESWCKDPAVRAQIAAQMAGIIIES